MTSAEILIMNCTTRLGATSQLFCIPPSHADNFKVFQVFFKPQLGKEERVVLCSRTPDWGCNNNPGFYVNHSNHHEITLPESFLKESGNFTCKITNSPSDYVLTCAWTPSANTTNNEYVISRNSSLLEGGSNEYTTRDSGITIASTVVPVVIVIGIIVTTLILLLKGRKCKRNKGSSIPGQKKPDKGPEESFEEELEITSQLLLPGHTANPEVSNKEEGAADSKVQHLASRHRDPYKRVHRRISHSDPEKTIKNPLPKKKTNTLSIDETERILCIFPPRLCLKTLVWPMPSTTSCYTAVVTLTKEQSNLIPRDLPRLFLLGPPGTGKSVTLLLKCIKWLKLGHGVHIVSTGKWNRAACSMLYHLLLQKTKQELAAWVTLDQLYQHHYDFENNKEVEKALSELSLEAQEGSLFVIVDEVGPAESLNFKIFCEKLLSEVDDLHLWAATHFHQNTPNEWEKKRLTTPLRSPQVVYKEVMKQTVQTLIPYNEPLKDDKTDGPKIRQIDHRSHSEKTIQNCTTCGHQIGSALYNLHGVDLENIATASPSNHSVNGGPTLNGLQWRDMLVLHSDRIEDEDCFIQGLREHSVPVRVMTDDDIDDVATAETDTVWVANGDLVRGLERQLIVCLGVDDNIRLRCMSRCTSQLVTIIS